MANQNHNPFVLPGFGQAGEMAQNPIIASMEMMRQAWQGLASTPGLGHSALSAPMSVEDLDRRIADLRAVENWLRMNLSMLSSTIQGMEVQRATISTLKSFVSATAGAGASPDGRSPLEVVLGIQHPGGGDSATGGASAPKASTAEQKTSAQPEDGKAAGPEDAFNAQAVATAAQGWWEMVQKQFDTLAAATAATLQGAEEARNAVQHSATHESTPNKPAARPATKAARKAAPAPTAPRTGRKTVARKSSTTSGKT